MCNIGSVLRQQNLHLRPLVKQHARHDHLERDHLELFDAEPRDDGAAWHEDLLAPDVRAVGDQLVHGRAWQGLGLELRRGLT